MGGWWLKKTGVTDGRKMRPEAIPEDRFGTSLSVGIGLSRNDADHVGSPLVLSSIALAEEDRRTAF
jgi:hypothetical protein